MGVERQAPAARRPGRAPRAPTGGDRPPARGSPEAHGELVDRETEGARRLGRLASRPSASRTAVSRCCAPSWRLRWMRLRSSSATSTRRAREARSACSALPVGDVAQVAGEHRGARERDLRDRQLDRELGAVPAHRGQLETAVEDLRACTVEEACKPGAVRWRRLGGTIRSAMSRPIASLGW